MNDDETRGRGLSDKGQSGVLPATGLLDQFVRSSPWAAGVLPETLDRLVAATSLRTLAAGEVLCRQGDAPQHWFGVISGLMRQDVFSRDGDRIALTAGRLGNWVGEGALLLGEPRRYEISALRESRVACVGAVAFAQAIEGDPQFNRTVLRMLSARLHYYMELYTVQRGADPEQRVARLLLSLVGHTPHGLHLHLDITQDELAQLAGVSRQRAHQALHTLQERGLLEVSYGAIKLLDVEGLNSR